MSAREGVDARILAELLGNNCCGPQPTEIQVLRSAFDSMSNELMTLYHLFWHTKIFEGEDFPGDGVTQQVLYMANRARCLARLGIAAEGVEEAEVST